MKVLLFSGNHSRQTFVHQEMLKDLNICGIDSMSHAPETTDRYLGGEIIGVYLLRLIHSPIRNLDELH